MEPTGTSEDSPVKSDEHVEGKRDLAWALILCGLVVIIVRSFLFEPFKIPSSSMVPTLRIGDHIFVSKFNYGLAIPFTKFEFLSLGTPKRGEVVVFLFPRDESLHYIKRVVGVPGDRIEIKGREIKINGVVVPKEKVTDPKIIEQVTGSPEMSGELYQENLDGHVHYVRYTRGGVGELSATAQVETVPPDKFFMMGDNRDDSYDSRSWGYVPKENIKGRARVIWLSLDQDEPWGKMTKVRWNRSGTPIQ